MLPDITERAFITSLAKIIEADAWAHVPGWYRARCAERMLDAKTPEQREAVAIEHRAALDLLRAIENEVTTKRDMIDGRSTRHTGTDKASARAGGTKQRSTPAAAHVAGRSGPSRGDIARQ